LCWDAYYDRAGATRMGNAKNKRAKEWQKHKIEMVAKIRVNRIEWNTEIKENITKDILCTEI
jgi:hypothetical protein